MRSGAKPPKAAFFEYFKSNLKLNKHLDLYAKLFRDKVHKNAKCIVIAI